MAYYLSFIDDIMLGGESVSCVYGCDILEEFYGMKISLSNYDDKQ
jgi:hypothetical protein